MDKRFKDYMDLLLIKDENKSLEVYIKDFDRFMLNRQKIKIKYNSEDNAYNVSVVKKTLKNIEKFVSR